MSVILYKCTSKNAISRRKTEPSRVKALLKTGDWFPSKGKAISAFNEEEIKRATLEKSKPKSVSVPISKPETETETTAEAEAKTP